ncbi:MAG: hypothetical protein Kow0069_33610 [Promethearchaeota archaeon]
MPSTGIGLQASPSFDGKRMAATVRKFSFPRLAGTPGGARAEEMCTYELRTTGVEPVTERFAFSTHYANLYVRGSLALWAAFQVLFLVHDLLSTPTTAALLLTFGLLLAPYLPWLVHVLRSPMDARPVNASSANVYGVILARSERPRGVVVVSAHHDSKSQRISVWARVCFSVATMLNSIFVTFAVVVVGVFGSIYPLNWVLRVALALNVAFCVTLAANSIKNESLGSVDDAAGVAIVLELAKHLVREPLENYDAWVVLFGAEELGTMGSRFFLARHRDALDPRTTFAINFDMVDDRLQYLRARGAFPPKLMCPNLGPAFEEVATELGVAWGRYALLTGASSDQRVFFKAGIEAIDFQDRSGAKWAHSRKDSPNKVNPRLLEQSCSVAWGIMKRIDSGRLQGKNSNELRRTKVFSRPEWKSHR